MYYYIKKKKNIILCQLPIFNQVLYTQHTRVPKARETQEHMEKDSGGEGKSRMEIMEWCVFCGGR